MATTFQDVITEALKDLGELAPGETPSADDLSDGLVALNELIARWDVIRLNIFCIQRASQNVSAGTGSYTIGLGGTFNVNRPTAIKAASYLTSGGFQLPIKLISAEEFRTIIDANRQGKFAEVLWYDGNYPLGTINIWPVPANNGDSLILFTWEQLTQGASLATTFDMPPGYQSALRKNLAVEIATMYGRPLDPNLDRNAAKALAALRSTNAPPFPGGGAEIQASGSDTPVPPDAAGSIS
jgi:hypothetical protein